MGFMDKARNKLQQLSGKGKEHTGRAAGDRELQAEGRKDRTAGDIKQAGENVKDAFRR
ncbi:MAG TPA: CsbD family protein [Pseudonocardia sp.]|nr:CsbD family protein [Pseudonocardia sp.]